MSELIRTEEQRLARLQCIYEQIPSFTCKDHCSECCGPIRWAAIEDLNIRRYLAEHGMDYITRQLEPRAVIMALVGRDSSGITCPYVVNDRCSIYPVRPLVCRLQGIYPEKLPCPFITPAKIISKKEVDKIWAKVAKL